MTINLVLPACLAVQNESLTKRYKMIKHPYLYGPCFDNLSGPRIAFFKLLYDKLFTTARINVRKQAGRSIERLLSYLIELRLPRFFIATDGCIPARVRIMDDITLRIRLRDPPQRTPKTWFCTDLRQVEQTLDTAEQYLQ